MLEATEIVWQNGKIIPREQANPSIASHSLHLGIGVFDGIMAYWNHGHYYIHEVNAHLTRFKQNSHNMGLKFSWSEEELEVAIQELLEQLPARDYYIRPITYRSVPQVHVNQSEELPVDVAILAFMTSRNISKSLDCHLSNYERVSGVAIPVAWKVCGTYVNSYLVRRAAQKAGFNDGIMLDHQGRLTEASAANLFCLTQEAIITPALTPDIFPGITRLTVLKIAKQLGIEVVEQDVFPEDIPKFQGAFLASTFMELKPLNKIDNFQYNSDKNPIFLKILNEFREITHQ